MNCKDMKFFMDSFSKCKQVQNFLRIWLHLFEKPWFKVTAAPRGYAKTFQQFSPSPLSHFSRCHWFSYFSQYVNEGLTREVFIILKDFLPLLIKM